MSWPNSIVFWPKTMIVSWIQSSSFLSHSLGLRKISNLKKNPLFVWFNAD